MSFFRERHLVALAGMAIVLMMLLMGWNGWLTWQSTERAIQGQTLNLTQAVERHALQVLVEARGLVTTAEAALHKRDLSTLSGDRDLWNSLRTFQSEAEGIETLAVVDMTGHLALSTRQFPPPPFDVSQDPDFRAILRTEGLYLGGLRRSPVTGHPQFVVGQRLRDGRGVIFVGVDVAAMEEVYAARAQDKAIVGMFRDDGVTLYRFPFNEADIGGNALRQGRYAWPAASEHHLVLDTITGPDGAPRSAALKRLERFPVVVMGAISSDAAVRQWASSSLIRLALGIVACALIVAFATLAIRQMRREIAANSALEELNRGLEDAVAERTRQLSSALADEQRASALAEAATQAKSRFLTAVGHDMRQPLQAIRLYQQSLAMRLREQKDVVAILEQMGQAVHVSEGLLNGIMEIGRIEAGRVVIEPQALPFDDLALMVQGMSGATLIRCVPCRAVLWADPVVVGRILGNLVANAIKHGHGGRVLVGCRRAANGGLRLMVVDRGGGIPSDKLDAIFEEFYQLGNTERSRDKGLGLGLAIARRLATACGYGLTVSSSPRGSVFSVHLPAEAVQSWPAGRNATHVQAG